LSSRNEGKSRDLKWGLFSFHGSFSKKAVQMFERNIGWLKIEVRYFFFLSTVNLMLTLKLPSEEICFGKNRFIFSLERQSCDRRDKNEIDSKIDSNVGPGVTVPEADEISMMMIAFIVSFEKIM